MNAKTELAFSPFVFYRLDLRESPHAASPLFLWPSFFVSGVIAKPPQAIGRSLSLLRAEPDDNFLVWI